MDQQRLNLNLINPFQESSSFFSCPTRKNWGDRKRVHQWQTQPCTTASQLIPKKDQSFHKRVLIWKKQSQVVRVVLRPFPQFWGNYWTFRSKKGKKNESSIFSVLYVLIWNFKVFWLAFLKFYFHTESITCAYYIKIKFNKLDKVQRFTHTNLQ